MTFPIDTTIPDDMLPAELLDATEVSADDVPDPDAVGSEVPDRADAPVSEITERFLKVVIAHVPLDRIEELHLFSPLRQGGVETGIAVIAARVPVVVLAAPATPELPFDDPTSMLADVLDDVLETADDTVMEPDANAAGEAVDAAVSEAADDVLEVDVLAELAPDDARGEADVLAEADDAAAIETTPVPRLRHTVYTARYRLVQKGPERGKWEADVVAEAEAPLITVDLVVRGVQRRAGEESEIVRYSAQQLARALRVPSPAV